MARTAAARRRKEPEAKLSIRGFGQIEARDARTGKVVWRRKFKNIVTEIGLRDFLVNGIHSSLSGSNIGYAGIGSGATAPASTQTALVAEHDTRKAVTGALVASRTLRNTWSYATNEGNASAVNEVGLFYTNSAGAMFSRATFASSQKTTAQTLAFTYDVVFNTA